MTPKDIRKQVKNVAQDLIGDAFAEEIHAKVTKRVNERLDALEKYVKSQMEAMNKRAEETQSYLVRQVSGASIKSSKP